MFAYNINACEFEYHCNQLQSRYYPINYTRYRTTPASIVSKYSKQR